MYRKEVMFMAKEIILNADMGEGFGCYRLCNEAALMPYLTSVNLACGFHAGDPMVMRNSVELAVKNGVSIGAHPGFADRQGFGRRMIQISEDELYCDLMYQFGALDAFVKKAGGEITHVSPHGVMDPLVSENENFARVFMDAIKDFKKDMYLVIEAGNVLAELCEKEGLRVASVGYPDLEYDLDGHMIITRTKELMDPQKILKQALSMVLDNKYLSVDGKQFPITPKVLCLHSDVPNSLEIMRVLRSGLEEVGVGVVGF